MESIVTTLMGGAVVLAVLGVSVMLFARIKRELLQLEIDTDTRIGELKDDIEGIKYASGPIEPEPSDYPPYFLGPFIDNDDPPSPMISIEDAMTAVSKVFDGVTFLPAVREALEKSIQAEFYATVFSESEQD